MEIKSITGSDRPHQTVLAESDSLSDSESGWFCVESLRSRVTRFSSQVQNKLAPSWLDNRVDNLLFAPRNRRPSRVPAPRGFKEEYINSVAGAIQSVSIGSGQTVVFVHGWGGSSSQFFPLMRGLAQCGYNALSFDHMGYGRSKPARTTLAHFIATTNEVLRQLYHKQGKRPIAVVGHSTGCNAIVNVPPELIENIPLLLISPIFDLKSFFLKKLAELQFHPNVVDHYARFFDKNGGANHDKPGLARQLAKFSDLAVIAHDELDDDSAIQDSIKFCKENPLTRLLVTKQYGHSRIISSESVWQELKSVVGYDDITIGFANKF